MMAIDPNAAVIALGLIAGTAMSGDAALVSALDLRFQAAVKHNDADAIDAILHPHYLLVLGDGTKVTRAELIAEARDRTTVYDIQDEDDGTQSVSVWGDTAVVTARLRIKGSRAGQRFDRTLWFTDTYVRTPTGWRYAYAQASLPLADQHAAAPGG